MHKSDLVGLTKIFGLSTVGTSHCCVVLRGICRDNDETGHERSRIDRFPNCTRARPAPPKLRQQQPSRPWPHETTKRYHFDQAKLQTIQANLQRYSPFCRFSVFTCSHSLTRQKLHPPKCIFSASKTTTQPKCRTKPRHPQLRRRTFPT